MIGSQATEIEKTAVQTPLIDSHEIELVVDEDPSWLAELRGRAWSRLKSLGRPGNKEERFRYTDLDLLEVGGIEQHRLSENDRHQRVARSIARLTQAIPPGGLGASIQLDGRLVTSTLSAKALEKNVLLMDLHSAAREFRQIIEPYLAQLIPGDDYLTARSLAYFTGGLFLYVPPETKLEAPINLLNGLSGPGASAFWRNLVVIDRGAEVMINNIHHSEDFDSPALSNPVTEIYVGDGAKLSWLDWQDLGGGARHIGHVRAKTGADTHLTSLFVTLGGDFSRTTMESVLDGPGAESLMLGLYLPGEKQQFEHWTQQDHRAPNTKSDLLYKGALTGEAKSLYYGTIKVAQNAPRTNAYQADKNLLLSENAKADSNPQLEIENNDVRCTHGATVGRLNEEHLFYLMSRGLPRPEAEKLVVRGFFQDVLQRADFGEVSDLIIDEIDKKLAGNLPADRYDGEKNG